MSQLNLSAREYHRTQSVKLARTIADLAGCEEIQSVYLAEALHATQPTEVDAEPGVERSSQEQGWVDPYFRRVDGRKLANFFFKLKIFAQARHEGAFVTCAGCDHKH